MVKSFKPYFNKIMEEAGKEYSGRSGTRLFEVPEHGVQKPALQAIASESIDCCSITLAEIRPAIAARGRN